MLSRLIETHAIIINAVRGGADWAAGNGDDRTSELLRNDILRCHELHAWRLAEQLLDTLAQSPSQEPTPLVTGFGSRARMGRLGRPHQREPLRVSYSAGAPFSP
jgi:hypothetical protein